MKRALSYRRKNFERPTGIGPGSVGRTLNHLVGAMFFFADRLNRRAQRLRLERDERTKTAAELLGKRLPMAISPFVWVNTVNPA